MKSFTLTHRRTAEILYSGTFPSLRHCVESALADRVCLSGIDLRDANLTQACLDGGDFRGADFTGAGLEGANLSECDLTGASLTSCDLTLACLCDSRLAGVDCRDASFSATLVAGAQIDSCTFSCPSTFTLDFAAAHTGRNTWLYDAGPGAGQTRPFIFTGAPVVITGLPARIVLLDDAVLLDNRPHPRTPAHADTRRLLETLLAAA